MNNDWLIKKAEEAAEKDILKNNGEKVSMDNQYRGRSVLSNDSLLPVLSTELKSEDYKIEWIWEGFLAKGQLTLFSALWKAGKSTLIVLLLKAIEDNKLFCGQETKKVQVLVISEESKGLWARRHEDFNIQTPFWILCRPIKRRLNYDEWVNLLEYEAKFCLENKVELLIIDTVSSFWNVENENDASRVQAALIPLNYLLEKNIAVCLIHHFRKSGGDEGTASRGSGALGSYADIIVELKRMPGETDSPKRVLKSYSRFEETPPEIVIELIDDEYVTLGTKSVVDTATKLAKVLQTFKDFPNGATSRDIYENWDSENQGNPPKERTIRRRIKRLLDKGEVIPHGERFVGKTKAPVYVLRNAGQDRPVHIGGDIEKEDSLDKVEAAIAEGKNGTRG